jgi:hypothetical protein
MTMGREVPAPMVVFCAKQLSDDARQKPAQKSFDSIMILRCEVEKVAGAANPRHRR